MGCCVVVYNYPIKRVRDIVLCKCHMNLESCSVVFRPCAFGFQIFSQFLHIKHKTSEETMPSFVEIPL